ncbi:MAG: exodeoxyribonuclease VII large subunit [Fulvivirga sp.]|uniref:exodeoxyribonuclease VII large subunit n=1 Tax=Fulvivirga sp. TaxID=1931237 RepID=UPI0032EC5110
MSAHLSLLELNKLIQSTLSGNLEPGYWVIAEISELKVNQNGHCYIELVEKDEQRVIAKTRATIWANVYNNLSLWFERMTNQVLKPGMKILCFGSIQFHELYGLSFNIKDIDANFTLGERERLRQEVINKLMEDGVFDMNKELPVDLALNRIAIISSPAAAGYEDFMNQIEANEYGYKYNIDLFKATMQGSAASESIINALHTIYNSNTDYDAVIIIRGGGSRVDLDCFDDYELAFNACQFPIPIITGIGHERDQSILDLVAYKALKTPTAVAEWVIGKSMDVESTMIDLMHRTGKYVQLILNQKRTDISSLTNRLSNSFKIQLSNNDYQLNRMCSQLKSDVKLFMKQAHNGLDDYGTKVNYLNPINTLKRGYSITSKNGKMLGNEKLNVGDIIETRTLYSLLESKVQKIDDLNEED